MTKIYPCEIVKNQVHEGVHPVIFVNVVIHPVHKNLIYEVDGYS